MVVNERTLPSWARDPRVRVGAVVAVAGLVALGVWLLVRNNDNGGNSGAVATGPSIGPVAASEDRLRQLAGQEGHDIYWVGPEANTTYELTRTSAGRIFVRYLPKGVPNGGIAVYSSSQPTNVYVAYPGSNLQIEVFDPSAERAQRLVTSGQVEPV